MKAKKYEIVVCFVTLACVAFTIGFLVGRQSAKTQVVIQAEPLAAGSTTDVETETQEQIESVSDAEDQQQSGVLNINTATAAQLDALPGIGEVLAERIVNYRESHGPFASIEELMDVSGIGVKKFEAICDWITVGGEAGGIK